MEITIYTEELVNKIRSTSHREVEGIEDVDVRYRAEAGSEKLEEIYGCLSSALSRLRGRCSRWLMPDYKKAGDNVMPLPSSCVFSFMLSERRAINKTEPLTAVMETFLIEYALSRFYSNVSMSELSNKHSMLALDAGNEIDALLFTKQPPRV